jgi:hypothetical protein
LTYLSQDIHGANQRNVVYRQSKLREKNFHVLLKKMHSHEKNDKSFCSTVIESNSRQELAFCAEVQKVSLRVRAQPLSSTRPQVLDHNLSCPVPVVPAAVGAMSQRHTGLRDGCD